MLSAVTSRKEIGVCQRVLVEKLQSALPVSEKIWVGYPSGREVARVHYDDSLWYATKPMRKEPIPRFWNAFGIGVEKRSSLNIIAEINTPISGYSRQVSGIFARDPQSHEVLLLHRGRIGGGRSGVSKTAFLDWYRGAQMEVCSFDGRVDQAILISRLHSSKLTERIREFIQQVAQFKAEVRSSQLSRQPLTRPKQSGFKPEFFGRKFGKRSTEFEYESLHGLVVNELENYLRIKSSSSGVNIYNTRAMDLGIEESNRLTHIFEVKSSTDWQSIYTGIGQLYVHSVNEPTAIKTLVLPAKKQNSGGKRLLAKLGINLLEYEFRGRGVRFLK